MFKTHYITRMNLRTKISLELSSCSDSGNNWRYFAGKYEVKNEVIWGILRYIFRGMISAVGIEGIIGWPYFMNMCLKEDEARLSLLPFIFWVMRKYWQSGESLWGLFTRKNNLDPSWASGPWRCAFCGEIEK